MSFEEQIPPPPPDVPPLYPASNVHMMAPVQADRSVLSAGALVDRRAGKHPGGNAGDIKDQLVTIHDELEQLRLRRQQLEEKRIRLLAASLPPSRHTSKLEERSTRSGSQTSYTKKAKRAGVQTSQEQNVTVAESRRSNTSVSRTSSATRRHPFAASNDLCIPSESTRRQNLQDDPYFQLKDTMKKATEKDTMCMIGSFLLEDNSKVYTFGRERRFRALTGKNGKYYLSTDPEVDQSVNRRQQRSHSAGFVRPTYRGTPGPGAYTPRYGKLSKPSILTMYQ